MAYRYTDTDKWSDSWFCALKPTEKVLFEYLRDNCDIAGFIEIIPGNWINPTQLSLKEIEGALKGLERGLIISDDASVLYLRTFLKHQKNLPLNENNKAHQGILKRFDKYLYKFNIQSVDDFIERGLQGACKGLRSPSGNGNGNGNGNEGVQGIKTWRDDFEIYKSELKSKYLEIVSDKNWIEKMQKYHPNLDIVKTVEKSCVLFWATEAGWKHKKSKRIKDIDWQATLTKALGQKINAMYLPFEKTNGHTSASAAPTVSTSKENIPTR